MIAKTNQPTTLNNPGFIKRVINQVIYKELYERRIVDNSDVMRLFMICRSTLNQWCEKGRIPYSKIGSKRIFDMWELEEVLFGKGKG